jgi:predicted SAM-dependent methyltransferase
MKVINGKLQIIRGDDVPQPVQRGRQLPPSHPQHQHIQSQAYTKQNDFYNKFLQAQQQQQVVEEEEIELTPEQIAAQQQYHKRLMMIQYIKNQQQRIHVGRVKSKKMKFV